MHRVDGLKRSAYGNGTLIEVDASRVDAWAVVRSLKAIVRNELPSVDCVVGHAALWVEGDVTIVQAPCATTDIREGRVHRIEVVFDGEDLHAVALAVGLSPSRVIDTLCRHEHRVLCVGFLPGFAYLSTDARFENLARKAVPRPRVAQGTVALAAGFAGIYPVSSPGGWNLIGRTNHRLLSHDEGAVLEVGDRVIFCAVDALSPIEPDTAHAWTDGPLRIERAAPLTTVQDEGRPGYKHRGFPISGWCDAERAHAANIAVGNAPHAPVIEYAGGALTICVDEPVVVSVDGETVDALRPGDRFTAPGPGPMFRYLAVAGGVDGPTGLGSRSTFAAIAFPTRALRSGDRLSLLRAPTHAGRTTTRKICPVLEVEARWGPHAELFSRNERARLIAAHHRVSPRSDRIGMRLVGPSGLRHQVRMKPFPLVQGAVQVTSDGTLVVMGPDHPVTGGYPVVCVLTAEGWRALASCSVGTEVTLRID